MPLFARALAVTFVYMCGIASANAGIAIGQMYHQIDSTRVTEKKRIYNNGSDTAFVRVDVLELDIDSQELPPSDIDITQSLLVSPSRMIIPPGGTQTVRLIALGPREKERYFRVRYIPVAPNKHGEFPDDESQTEAGEVNTAGSVSVLIGYGTLVTVAPKEPRFKTRIDRAIASEALHNEGNTTVIAEHHRICPANGRECSGPTRDRIKPGKSLALATTADSHHRFDLIEGSRKTSMTVGLGE